MPRAIISRRARRDLKDLFAHLVREGADRIVAQRFVASLAAKCEELADLPGTLGVARSDLSPGLRSFAFRGYLLFFTYSSKGFLVARIIEGHRDMPRQVSRPGS